MKTYRQTLQELEDKAKTERTARPTSEELSFATNVMHQSPPEVRAAMRIMSRFGYNNALIDLRIEANYLDPEPDKEET